MRDGVVLPRCWEIRGCGRERGGVNESELGLCPAYPHHGHSCWIIAGTFCNTEVTGTFAREEYFCGTCEVYKQYSSAFGSRREELKRECPDEYAFCLNYFSISRPPDTPPRDGGGGT